VPGLHPASPGEPGVEVKGRALCGLPVIRGQSDTGVGDEQRVSSGAPTGVRSWSPFVRYRGGPRFTEGVTAVPGPRPPATLDHTEVTMRRSSVVRQPRLTRCFECGANNMDHWPWCSKFSRLRVNTAKGSGSTVSGMAAPTSSRSPRQHRPRLVGNRTMGIGPKCARSRAERSGESCPGRWEAPSRG
jgi:hypothetical protein